MSEIYEYYKIYDESTRLTRDKLHLSEYRIMMHLLEKYLDEAPLKILDCCAGCGVYSFAMADIGHVVTAGDLIPEHIKYMKAHDNGLAEIYEGNACDLSRFEDASFDVVLNFGAMYHLQKENERRMTVSECLRVLKKGGIFAYAYQTLAAMLVGQYRIAYTCMDKDARLKYFMELENCKHTHCRDVFYGMTYDEIENIARENNLTTITNASTYAVFYPFFLEIDDLNDEEYDKYTDMLIQTCEDRAVAKNTMHGVYFGRK